MLKDIKIKKHKQSQYMTLMLVPYSQRKTISMKIPYWIFHVMISVFVIVFTAVSVTAALSYVRSIHFKSIANEINNDLEKSIELNSEIVKQRDEAASIFRREKVQLETNVNEQKESYEEQIRFYDEKSKELESQLDELDKLKNDIYNSINALTYNSPSVNELKAMLRNMEGSDGMGGASSTATLDERLFELEMRIESEFRDLHAINTHLGKIKYSADKHPSIWPVNGRITSTFGYRRNPFGFRTSEFHDGLDIAVPTGTLVKAAASGTVTFSGYSGGYGYLIKISHGSGIETYYAHNSALLVEIGDKVLKGDHIAKAGSTGRSTGPHVHYEVRLNNIPQDPMNYLR